MDTRVGTWNVSSMYRADLFMTVGVQEVRWDRGSTKSAGEYTRIFLYGKGNDNHELGICSFRIKWNHING
jgi:hypothetical protein